MTTDPQAEMFAFSRTEDGMEIAHVPQALPAFQVHSETSKRAARRIAKDAPSMLERIAAFIRDRGSYGATRNELHEVFGFKIQTLCGRLDDLEGRPDREGRPRLPVRIRKTTQERDGCRAYVYINLEGR